ncbi:MAG: hypothetical protein NT067_05985 [Candidatus Diapherotrites archaeon]|nr:hypothetical protein [Candidatus Diapherotrites archaeon]
MTFKGVMQMEERAQVSFDYLILLTFVIGLVMVVSVLVTAIQGIADRSIAKVRNYSDSTLSSILKG